MTAPAHPLPGEGGSYLRQADGSLIPVDRETDAAPTSEPTPVAETPTGIVLPQKSGRKAPVKEA